MDSICCTGYKAGTGTPLKRTSFNTGPFRSVPDFNGHSGRKKHSWPVPANLVSTMVCLHSVSTSQTSLSNLNLFQPHAGNYWSHFHISFSPRAGNFTPENIQPSLLMSFLAFSAHQAQSCNFDLALCFFCQNGSCNL